MEFNDLSLCQFIFNIRGQSTKENDLFFIAIPTDGGPQRQGGVKQYMLLQPTNRDTYTVYIKHPRIYTFKVMSTNMHDIRPSL